MTRWTRDIRAAIARPAGTLPARAAIRVLDRLAGSPSNVLGVLTYHRIDDPRARPWLYPRLLSATPGGFEEQMTMLLRDYRPVSMSDVLAAFRGHRALQPRSVLVTFDDGYLDFAQSAWPILRRLGIPATLFVATGYPDQPQESFWWDRLWAAMTMGVPADEAGSADRRREATELVERMKTLPHAEAMRRVDDAVQGTPAAEIRSETLGWDELRTLAAEGVDMAPHSQTHPLLTKVPPEVMRAEIEGSITDIALRFPAALPVFAYPDGAHNEPVTALLRKLGVELAFTTHRGHSTPGRTEPLSLRRNNVGLRADANLIRSQLVVGTLQRRLSR